MRSGRQSSTPSIPRLSLDSARLSLADRVGPPLAAESATAVAAASAGGGLDKACATRRSDALATVSSRNGGAHEADRDDLPEDGQALALGSGALDGLRSARFTPATTPATTPRGMNARPPVTCAEVMHSVSAKLPSPSLLRTPQEEEEARAAAAAAAAAAAVEGTAEG